MQTTQMTGTGFELPHRNAGKTAIPDQNGAECGALGAQSGLIDPDLAAIIERWADLPQAVRAGMVAMVRATDLFANQR